MSIEIIEVPITAVSLAEYALVPIAFEVGRVLDVVEQENGGFILTERDPGTPYVKDYDAIHGEGPARWSEQFDLSNWGMLVARIDGARVGGAVIAFDTPGVKMLEGRNDLAVLWDIRVVPTARSSGVGSALFAAAGEWARRRGCRQLKVETQNINSAACRFYERQGCRLEKVDRHAYPELPEEIQMLWYRDLIELPSSTR